MIGRNDAYLQQFVTRGTPRRLAERDRRLLAAFLDIDEQRLGAPDPVAPGPVTPGGIAVPWLSVEASAGPGAATDSERLLRTEVFPAAMLREAGVSPVAASLIVARGDSMEPTIRDGDRLLVDRADRRATIAPAIRILRHDGDLAVKRVRRDGATLVVTSDNPAWPERRLPLPEVAIVGRVKLLIRTP